MLRSYTPITPFHQKFPYQDKDSINNNRDCIPLAGHIRNVPHET